jgi:hypothetical protein
MYKKWVFIFLILVLFLSIQACTSTQSAPDVLVVTVVVKITATPKPIEEPKTPTYTVTKDTGLYDALNVSANVIADLSTGSKLIPANGATRLDCSSFVDAGITYELCKVEVVKTGQTGWVLKKWISKD